ncbi:RNA polymerase sigma factor [Streptomyces sp. BI20]|uniref:RNA polymerase sigma factor n=1 Tax=Streptomyces sp. BI20 TaxID=3403460 RepID=UPI003C72CD24
MTEIPTKAPAVRAHIIPRPRPREDFDAFYRREMTAVTVHLMYRGASAYEAADAAHEAFIPLLPQRWRTIEHPRAYLRKVAWTQYLRQARHREEPEDPVPDRPGGTCPIDEVILTDTQRRVLRAVRSLPPAQREVIAWTLDGFSYAEIAKFTGKTEPALRTNAKRGRDRLRRLLAESGIVGHSEGRSSDA